MEGYAANNVTHAVRHCDVKEKSCSVIMRGCLKLRWLRDAESCSMNTFHPLSKMIPK